MIGDRVRMNRKYSGVIVNRVRVSYRWLYDVRFDDPPVLSRFSVPNQTAIGVREAELELIEEARIAS